MPSRAKLVVIVMTTVAGLIPVFFYWYVIGRVPGAAPSEVRDLLEASESRAVLVDVRAPEPFAEQHIAGSFNWPLTAIRSLRPGDRLPDPLKGKDLYLICDSGISSAVAAQRILDLSLADARYVRGGIGGFNTRAGKPCGLDGLRALFRGSSPVPYRESPLLDQWALVLSAFAVKPAYMLGALALILLLRRRKSKGLIALRWGLLVFLIGESACAVNYLLVGHTSHLLEYLHSSSMALCFGFVTFAAIEGIDARIVHFTDPGKKCALLGFCPACYKYTDVPCALKRLFYLVIPVLFVLAFMPLMATTRMVSYNGHVLGALYNYTHPVLYQMFEIRYCPLLALLFFAFSFLVLVFKKESPVAWSKIFFSAGIGVFAFGLMRHYFFQAFDDDLTWTSFWEEATELLFVAAVGFILWVFARPLLAKEERA